MPKQPPYNPVLIGALRRDGYGLVVHCMACAPSRTFDPGELKALPLPDDLAVPNAGKAFRRERCKSRRCEARPAYHRPAGLGQPKGW